MRRSLLVLSLVVGVLVAVQSEPGGPVAQAAPPGFVDSLVTTRGTTLTTVEALPDGRVVVLEKGGRLSRVDDRDGSAEVVTLATFAVCSDSERGLLGFALDPAYVISGAVYVYRTVASDAPGGCHNRVSRFQMGDAGLDLASEQVLVDNISSVAGNHNGGDIEVGNDGYLYIAVGDAGRDPRGDSGSAGSNNAAQDLSLLNGKILRVDRYTGFAAPGNPFNGAGTDDCRVRGNTPSTPTTTCREVFAYGLRNPYRFAFDPNTSATRFFINDVGQGDREEVNDGRIGANYGWPAREGRCPQGQNPPCAGPTFGLVDPITDYGHDRGLFVTGGAFVPNGVWPAQYDGAYLVADGAFGTTWAWTGGVDLAASPVFLTASRPTDLAFVTGPTGPALWYVQQNAQVRKVVFQAPASADDSGPRFYSPLPAPVREFDSRELTPSAPLRAGQTRLIDLGAPTGATAALVNIALVGPQSPESFATVWEPRTVRPATSNVNAPLDAQVSNTAIVPLDANGRIVLFDQATSHVLVDVSGYFFVSTGPVSAGRFVATGPERIVDTRNPVGPSNAFARTPAGQGQLVTVAIAGDVDVPAAVGEIGAVALVLTGLKNPGGGRGFATAFSGTGTVPTTSSLNVDPGEVRANLVVVPTGADGRVGFYLEGVDDIAVDVVGYFTGAASPSATVGRFHLLAPRRDADSRVGLGFGRFGVGQRATLNPPSVPDSASGVAQNLTMTVTGGRGFVTAYPQEPLPVVSNVNSSGPFQDRAAFSATRLSTGGSEVFYAGDASTDLIVDVFGYFE